MIATAILFNPFLGAAGIALVLAITFWATTGYVWDSLFAEEPEPLPDPPTHVSVLASPPDPYDWRNE